MANIKIIFSIYGDSLDPLSFNKLVDVDNSVYWYKGDTIKNKQILRKETAWEYTVEFRDVYHLESVSDVFINKFKDKIFQIKQYIIQEKLKAKIDIIVQIANREIPSLYFNQTLIDFSSSIKSEIDIDLYILD
jgi:hypothetical protein